MEIEECSSSKETQTNAGPFERYLSTIFDNENHPYSGLTLCSLCSEPWVQDTDHRIVCLKCGHLFGESCLNKYLQSTKGGQKCPECQAPVRRPDIRTLFAKTVVAIDKSDEITMENIARKEATLYAMAGIEKNNATTNIKLFQNQLTGLKIQRQELLIKIEKLKARRGIKATSTFEQADQAMSICVSSEAKQAEFIDSVETPFVEASNITLGNFVRVHEFELYSQGDCRLLASSDKYGLIVCSQRSNSDLFEGYGVRTIGYSDFRPKMFAPLHKAQIKDIVLHPSDPILLTASLDKTVKQTNIQNGIIISTCPVEDAAWSCCWNESNPTRFFVGLKNGRVLEFDVRALHYPLNELKTSEKLPVASLSYVTNNIMKGVICTRLRGSEFYAHKTADLFERYPMPIMGNFTSAYYDNPSANFLISSRPFKRSANISHSVYNLRFAFNEDEDNYLFQCYPVAEYSGGIRADHVLRSKIYPHPNGNGHMVCVGDQDTNGFIIFDSNLITPLLKTNIGSPVFDTSLITPPNTDPHLICLTDNKLIVNKWSA